MFFTVFVYISFDLYNIYEWIFFLAVDSVFWYHLIKREIQIPICKNIWQWQMNKVNILNLALSNLQIYVL